MGLVRPSLRIPTACAPSTGSGQAVGCILSPLRGFSFLNCLVAQRSGKVCAMSSEAKERIQIALALALVVAGLRAGYILYERHEDSVEAQKQEKQKNVGYSNP